MIKRYWKYLVVALACTGLGTIPGYYAGQQVGTKKAIDTVFEFCYNSRAVILDEETGRSIACMGVHQTENERLEQKKFEQSLDKRNEA